MIEATIPMKPGREILAIEHKGARCYRLEKVKCGKPNCRCSTGELHGPYWYAYYREGGRLKVKYIGKRLSRDRFGSLQEALQVTERIRKEVLRTREWAIKVRLEAALLRSRPKSLFLE